ncbi:hypothetical protein ElyMa_003969800 [Elysia marginata]|uniref:Uncharacterized protein n=1 Tax=Elysia marginata TaxID=1093978 RepID=A0AAV4FVK3_9GAST|nr:hypothetical protein ElyMa_003969800 [Elysia marginata]
MRHVISPGLVNIISSLEAGVSAIHEAFESHAVPGAAALSFAGDHLSPSTLRCGRGQGNPLNFQGAE